MNKPSLVIDPKKKVLDKDKILKIQEFSNKWDAFLDSLTKDELSDKEFSSLLINYAHYVGNSLNQQILAGTTKAWKNYLGSKL